MIVYLLILFLDTITTKITKKIICIHKNNNNGIEIQVNCDASNNWLDFIITYDAECWWIYCSQKY